MRPVVILAACAFAIAANAQPAGSAPDDAAEILAITLGVERAALRENVGRRTALVAQREDALSRIGRLNRAVDEEFARETGPDPLRLDPLVEQLRRTGRELEAVLEAERELLVKIADSRRRVVLLEEKLAAFRERERPRQSGALTGSWDVVLLPSGLRGSWELRQDGTLVTGTYRLDGGWTGSLKGTLVNRKLYLERIDSKLGKMMEFEGYLGVEGQRLRGSWLNFELAGSAGSTGQWSAERKERNGAP